MRRKVSREELRARHKKSHRYIPSEGSIPAPVPPSLQTSTVDKGTMAELAAERLSGFLWCPEYSIKNCPQ